MKNSKASKTSIVPKSQNAVDALTPTNPWKRASKVETTAYLTGYLAARRLVNNIELTHQVQHDELTGLLNKKAFLDKAERRLQQAKPDDVYAMLFIDLDKFKAVNDLHPGKHGEGDMVLFDIARILDKDLRNEDIFMPLLAEDKERDEETARLGGDEFVILANLKPRQERGDPKLTPDQRLELFTQRLQHDFGQYLSFHPDLSAIGLGMSVGGVLVQPGQSAEQVLALSDQAMYLNKEQNHTANGTYR